MHNVLWVITIVLLVGLLVVIFFISPLVGFLILFFGVGAYIYYVDIIVPIKTTKAKVLKKHNFNDRYNAPITFLLPDEKKCKLSLNYSDFLKFKKGDIVLLKYKAGLVYSAKKIPNGDLHTPLSKKARQEP